MYMYINVFTVCTLYMGNKHIMIRKKKKRNDQ